MKHELLMKLREGEYSSIIVYKLDRFARSSRELILEIQELVDNGIGLISISEVLWGDYISKFSSLCRI
ncbi:recombinase family protein [Flavobacterium sp.]|uniref:recombinase family protein n=1 Tax=Flavobacterium sp. TaxID=239 RepID=UPI0033404969